MIALAEGFTDVAKAIIARSDVDLNVLSDDGFSALAWAVSHDREEEALCLVEAGASCMMHGDGGQKILDVVCQKGQRDVVKALSPASERSVDLKNWLWRPQWH